jgi:hypothetical protein
MSVPALPQTATDYARAALGSRPEAQQSVPHFAFVTPIPAPARWLGRFEKRHSLLPLQAQVEPVRWVRLHRAGADPRKRHEQWSSASPPVPDLGASDKMHQAIPCLTPIPNSSPDASPPLSSGYPNSIKPPDKTPFSRGTLLILAKIAVSEDEGDYPRSREFGGRGRLTTTASTVFCLFRVKIPALLVLHQDPSAVRCSLLLGGIKACHSISCGMFCYGRRQHRPKSGLIQSIGSGIRASDVRDELHCRSCANHPWRNSGEASFGSLRPVEWAIHPNSYSPLMDQLSLRMFALR